MREWLAADTAKPAAFGIYRGKLSALIRAGRQTGSSQAFGWRESRSCSEGAGFEPPTTGMARDYDHLFKLLIIGDSGKRRRGCVTGSGPARGSGGFECLVLKLWDPRGCKWTQVWFNGHTSVFLSLCRCFRADRRTQARDPEILLYASFILHYSRSALIWVAPESI